MKKVIAIILAIMTITAMSFAYAVDASDYWIATISSVEASQEYLDAAAIIYGGTSSNYSVLNAANALLNVWDSNTSYKVYTQIPDLAEEVDEDEIVVLYDTDLGFYMVTKGLLVFFDIRMTKSDYYKFGEALEDTIGEYHKITICSYQ